MAKRTQYQRLAWLGLLLCLAFAGLGYRLVDLQVLRHEELSAEAEKNTERKIMLEPRRGDILDIKGNPLATTIVMKNIVADPFVIGTNQLEIARALAPVLQTNEAHLVQALTPVVRLGTNGLPVTNNLRYACLSKRASADTWGKVENVITNLVFAAEQYATNRSQRAYYTRLRQQSIYSKDIQVRVYPSQSLASQVVGYAGEQNVVRDDQELTQLVGRIGIEKKFNERLTGTRGWRRTEADSKQREVVTLRDQEAKPADGDNVVLTIDSVIQHIVETALAAAMEKQEPLSVSGIVVRPRTGEILAMATLPTFDPNLYGRARQEEMRNRVVSDMAEPGSTFKIVTVSGALNEGLVRLTDCFDCEHGLWLYGGRKLHDHERYGVLSVEQIITKSSNIGAAKVGVKLGEDRLYEYIRRFGFGQYTGIPLPVEAPGYVDKAKWTKVSIAQIPMGQGISVTRLQMVMAMCAIANKGVLMRPMLVDRLEPRGRPVIRYSPQRAGQAISESTAQLMVQALKTVATTNGTAAKAALEHYTVAGKTGTAQKAEPGRGYVDKFFSSFIGFFPADNPELCISVTLDEPKHGHYGGLVAAPYFKQIAEAAANYLNIRPEDADALPRTDPVAALDTTPVRAAAARSP
jgi:cell division protein FtsI (penicillin-binding protein 3)